MEEYRDFAELSAAQTEGVNFRILCRPRDNSVAVVAPHGGNIEPTTDQIAAAIAGDDFGLYCFRGHRIG